jgi:phenylalanyl-tRNA synthetase beta chain
LGGREAPFVEPHRLGALVVGALAPPSWRDGGEPADFFALKGVLEGLTARLGAELSCEATTEPFLHPGRAARVLIDGNEAGWLGELHPLVARQWGLEAAVCFEVDLATLAEAATAGEEIFEDVTSFPAVRQDLAVVVPDTVAAAAVRDAVLAGGGELLHTADVFDLYGGEQLGEGRKSLALRLEFRAANRTLTDEEVATRRESIGAQLAEIGGSLRE